MTFLLSLALLHARALCPRTRAPRLISVRYVVRCTASVPNEIRRRRALAPHSLLMIADWVFINVLTNYMLPHPPFTHPPPLPSHASTPLPAPSLYFSIPLARPPYIVVS